MIHKSSSTEIFKYILDKKESFKTFLIPQKYEFCYTTVSFKKPAFVSPDIQLLSQFRNSPLQIELASL